MEPTEAEVTQIMSTTKPLLELARWTGLSEDPTGVQKDQPSVMQMLFQYLGVEDATHPRTIAVISAEDCSTHPCLEAIGRTSKPGPGGPGGASGVSLSHCCWGTEALCHHRCRKDQNSFTRTRRSTCRRRSLQASHRLLWERPAARTKSKSIRC